MKALFHRINRGLTKDKDRDRLGLDTPTATPKEKILQLPPLPEWPPPSTRVISTTSSLSSYKPLPEIAPQRPLPPISEPAELASSDFSNTPTPRRTEVSLQSRDSDTAINSPRPETEMTVRTSSRKNTTGSVDTIATITTSEQHKKVAFISPTTTPAGSEKERVLPEAAAPAPTNNGSVSGAPVKTTVSRFQATHGKDPRGSTSLAASASASKTDVSSAKAIATGSKATSTRTAVSPYPGSIRSGTPYSQMSNTSSRILAAASWSEGAEDDLVSNLGPRERTRQEVLWEIVASEERCV